MNGQKKPYDEEQEAVDRYVEEIGLYEEKEPLRINYGIALDKLSETGETDHYPDQTVYLAVTSLPDKYRAVVILYYE